MLSLEGWQDPAAPTGVLPLGEEDGGWRPSGHPSRFMGTKVIHADAARRTLESCALRQADDSMFRGVVRSALRTADQTAQRRAVDDNAAALVAHLPQLELHAVSYAAQIDGHHAVVVVTRRIGSLGKHILHVRVVVGGIQTSKLRDRLLHHGFHFRII
jgi:hypothetical protein